MSEHKVFISYSHRDLDAAWRNAFADALREQNVRVWIDESDLNPGDNWIEKMEIALRESDAIIAVISGSGGNGNLYFELGVAAASGKNMILVVDPSVRVSLPFDLRNQQQITMRAPVETARRVTKAIKAGH
jgi:hypothetical protein